MMSWLNRSNSRPLKLSPQNKIKLEELGLIVTEKIDSCFLMKEKGVAGNRLPNYTSIPIVTLNKKGETIEETTSDCPIMKLWFKETEYILSCWDWIPGPGPGDFEKTFSKEEDVMQFIISYYFGNNEFFEARKKYHE